MRKRKSTLKRIIAEATRSLNEGMHPYDKGLMQAMDAGYYSDHDAVSEIENNLRRVQLTRVDDTTITVSYGNNSRTVTFEDDPKIPPGSSAADKADGFEEDWEEMKYAMDGDYNDDAYDLLRSIPKEIKDLLPVQEFDDGMDDDWQDKHMIITKRQLRKIIKEERARLLSEAMTSYDVQDELEEMNQIAGKLLSALDTGGIETPDMGGLDEITQEQMRMTLENIRYELAQLGLKFK